MKKRIALILAALIVASAGVFWYCHPTHPSFNDRFVIGSTAEKITEKYGQPYSTTRNTMTYMIRDNTPELIMGRDNSLWYVIELEHNAAVNVYLRKGYPGG